MGSTTTEFRTRFNNHKSRMRRYINLDQAQRDQGDLLSAFLERRARRIENSDTGKGIGPIGPHGLNNGYKTSARGESEIVKSATFLIVNARTYVCPLI